MHGNCQSSFPNFDVYIDPETGDTLLNAVISLRQGQQILIWESEVRELEAKLSVKDSIISSNNNHILNLENKVIKYDSITQEYDIVIDFKNTEVHSLNETIDLQQRQIRKQKRGKIFGTIVGVLSGFGLGAGAAILFN